MHGDDKVDEYNIYNISSTYTIKNNKIYIEQATAYQTFLNGITLNGVTAKVFNTNNTQITSGNVDNNYVLKIFAGTTELASYTVSIEYYRVENVDTKTENNVNYIYKLDLKTPYTNLLSNITTSGTVEIKDKNQNTLESTDRIKTGDTVTIKLGSGDVSYKVSVLGDVYPDGEVDIRDINILYRYFMHPNDYPLSREFILAGNIYNDSKINGSDVGLLYHYYRDVLLHKEATLGREVGS